MLANSVRTVAVDFVFTTFSLLQQWHTGFCRCPCKLVIVNIVRLTPSRWLPACRPQPTDRSVRIDGELRPVLHLHPRHEPVFAALWLEDRGLALLDVEPVLAQGVDDIGLVGDKDVVL